MEKNMETDKIYIEKILNYINVLRETFGHFGINSAESLIGSEIASAAVTQTITNIYAAKKNLTGEILGNLNEFGKLKLSGARNIASHDYDSLNFNIIYDICIKLISDKIGEELRNELQSDD
jgi:uncharacterized protein with HEPN domain